MKLNFRNFNDLARCIKKNISILPHDIDLIVGIPRSGIIPAYMIALFLNRPVCSINEFLNNITPNHGERLIRKESKNFIKKVLIVDDSIHSGVSLNKTKEELRNIDTSMYQIQFLAIYARDESKHMVDYYFEILSTPRLFQWNYINHHILAKACVDIDGVLCLDPTEEENDDDENYLEFLLNTTPLYIPEYQIHSLVTSRLEKYRPQTEEWLKKHHVSYKNLYMLDLPSKAERIKQNSHATFKAEIYKKLKDTSLFIESNPRQAREIAILTQKPCICVETDEMFYGVSDLLSNNLPNTINSKPRILLFSHEMTYTGAPHSLLRICKILKNNNIHVEVWSALDGEFKKEFEEIGIIVKIISNDLLKENLIKESIKTFDLAIVNTIIAHRFFILADKLIPTIWFIREAQNIPEICKGNPARENALKTAKNVYCVSGYAKEFIEKNYNNNVKVLHNCVEDYYQKQENIIEGKINFICVGTVSYRKAFDVYIDAFEKMPQEYQRKSHLYFMGRLIEDRKDYWKPLLDRANHNSNITYIGEIKNTPEKISIYEKMNVFVVVSRDESCSLVVLEGAMMAKPIIVSENVGAKYMVEDGSGWIVKTDGVDELKQVFEYIIDNSHLLKKMGENSRLKYLSTSTLDIYEKNIIEMVNKHIVKKNLNMNTNMPDLNMALNMTKLELKVAKNEIENIHKSISFRVGRAITWFPRKLRGGIYCYRENGLRYTLRRIKEKLLKIEIQK